MDEKDDLGQALVEDCGVRGGSGSSVPVSEAYQPYDDHVHRRAFSGPQDEEDIDDRHFERATSSGNESSSSNKKEKKRSSWLASGKEKLTQASHLAAEKAHLAAEKASHAAGKASKASSHAAEQASKAYHSGKVSHGLKDASSAATELGAKLKGGMGALVQKAKNQEPPKVRNLADKMTDKMTSVLDKTVFRPSKRGDKEPLVEGQESTLADLSDDGSPSGSLNSLQHGAFIVDNTGKISDFYDIDKRRIGEGSYGSVSKAKSKSSGQQIAVKTISKQQLNAKSLSRIKQETALMRMMDHPNIIKLYESFEDFRNVYLVMELCSGGELFDRIIECGQFGEVVAAQLMKQMFQVIYYMHENQVAHRDIKPENFLFVDKAHVSQTMLKLIDFGLSKKFKADEIMSTKAGTPYYVSPQVLAGKYDQSCDLWSAGVLMYVLLCGYPPFFGETDAEVLSKVRLGNYSFNAADWKHISEDAKSLIRMLLKMNVRDRYTAQQAINHEWVAKKAPRAPDVKLTKSIVNNLRAFRSANRFKKAALHLIAHHMDGNKIKELRDIFSAIDVNNDGLLSIEEMKKGLEKALTDIPTDMAEILEQMDTSDDGVIDYTEFIAATLEKHVYLQEDTCWAAFRFFDRDGNGKISRAEIAEVLNDGGVAEFMDAQVIADVMKEVDTNGDGEIDFEEFMEMMRGAAPPELELCRSGMLDDRAAPRASGSPGERQLLEVPPIEAENVEDDQSDSRAQDSPTRKSLQHAAFIVDNAGKISDFYDIDQKKLGEGSFATVYAGSRKATGQRVAVKSMAKAMVKDLQKLKQETSLLRSLDHPNIVKLFESFEDFRNIYLVMELCEGGELFDRILEEGVFKEADVAILMSQTFQVIKYLHANQVCHRDLKPENFLFLDKGPICTSTLKIIDFGLSKKFTPGELMLSKVGSPFYVSSQVLAGKYDQSCDLWSAGVIMYVLLCGYPPFSGDTDAEVLSKVRLGNYSFMKNDWEGRSEDAKNLIRMLLKMNPRDRYTAEQALNHDWVAKKAPQAADVSLTKSIVDNLRCFRSANRFKKAALHLIAHQMDEKKIKQLREVFLALDENHDGLLSTAEMKNGVEKALVVAFDGLTEIPADMQEILEQMDTSGDGVIDYTEFIAATLERQEYLQEDVCWSAFRFFDRDGNGKISRAEIAEVLNNGEVADFMDTQVIAEVMRDFDTNGDGEIDFQEFMEMMRSTASRDAGPVAAAAAAAEEPANADAAPDAAAVAGDLPETGIEAPVEEPTIEKEATEVAATEVEASEAPAVAVEPPQQAGEIPEAPVAAVDASETAPTESTAAAADTAAAAVDAPKTADEAPEVSESAEATDTSQQAAGSAKEVPTAVPQAPDAAAPEAAAPAADAPTKACEEAREAAVAAVDEAS